MASYATLPCEFRTSRAMKPGAGQDGGRRGEEHEQRDRSQSIGVGEGGRADDEHAEHQGHDGGVDEQDRVVDLAVTIDQHRHLVVDLGEALPGQCPVIVGRHDEGETEPLSSEAPDTVVDGRVVGQHAVEQKTARRHHHDRRQDQLNRSPGGFDVHAISRFTVASC